MTTVNKPALVSIFATAIVAAGTTTKQAPPATGTGAWVDIQAYNGGYIGGNLKNTQGSPSVAPQVTWQWSPDAVGSKVYDIYTWGGDTVNNSVTSFSRPIPKEAKFIRALCYGHQTNGVTFESDLLVSN